MIVTVYRRENLVGNMSKLQFKIVLISSSTNSLFPCWEMGRYALVCKMKGFCQHWPGISRRVLRVVSNVPRGWGGLHQLLLGRTKLIN